MIEMYVDIVSFTIVLIVKYSDRFDFLLICLILKVLYVSYMIKLAYS